MVILFGRGFMGAVLYQCYDIIRTLDGGYIACGRDVNANDDAYVLKIDSLGNLQWQRTYQALYWKNFRSVEKGLDGGYVAVGTVRDFLQDTSRALILKIDSLGNILWERRYTVLGNTYAGKIYRLQNQYLVGGASNKIYFSKLDINGNITYTKIFPSTQLEYFGDIKVVNSNKYVIALSRDSTEASALNGKALITDSLGNIIYQRIFP
ncbi:MAG: hypothetical protein ACRDFC_05720, partial [Ignavibacteria bacterium]